MYAGVKKQTFFTTAKKTPNNFSNFRDIKYYNFQKLHFLRILYHNCDSYVHYKTGTTKFSKISTQVRIISTISKNLGRNETKSENDVKTSLGKDMAEKPFELINLEKLDMAEKFSSIRLRLIY